MTFLLLLGIAFGVASVMFALQNVSIVTVSFFAWQFEGSLALVLLLSLAMGVLISLLLVLPETAKNYFRYKKLKKSYERLE